VGGSNECALKTVNILRTIVAKSKWSTAQDLIEKIKAHGAKIFSARPYELCISNVTKRILYFIREEYASSQFEEIKNKTDEKSMQVLLKKSSLIDINRAGVIRVFDEDEGQNELNETYNNLKSNVLESIKDLLDEITSIYSNVSDQAFEHVHSNEVIMTLGRSHTVLGFLIEAGRKRKFNVIVADSAPTYDGRDMALKLSQEGIETTLIPDTGIHAMMSRVNKVIVGTHAVLANGGLIAPSGTHMLALAAKYHSVPFLVCTGLYKLSPVYYSQDSFIELKNPSEVIDLEDVNDKGDISVFNPSRDYVPPELVSLYITNTGGYNPSYIYRLLAEYYHPEDF